MPLLILLCLLAVPYLEFLVFLEVGSVIGGFQALLLTILSAIFGIYLIRQQGLVVMRRMHETLQQGESPIEEILHGFFLLIAGVFFLLPGFITDTIALALAIGPVRGLLGKMIINNIKGTFYKNNFRSSAQGAHDESLIIDGEFREEKTTQKKSDQIDTREI